jgi:alanyl-tRNA synthetase
VGEQLIGAAFFAPRISDLDYRPNHSTLFNVLTIKRIKMTSAELRQSFLDFFKSKGHTIVPSSSLLPDSPNLLFTNAGMNQFVPIFLGQRAPDVSKWPGAIPGGDTRAADTQKCIRAGGKHNDLEDVGLDTYHHTFFEMLGNWSFGDYFKKEAIEWAWELITEVWKFPKNRLYATVYSPDKAQGDPSDFDQEAHDFWAEKFRAAGLDPRIHIVYGNKKDNFWMMGDTGPCGPCSEIHVDLTPQGDTKGSLVNKGDARCIEIWNLVFIQFNANPDGTFSPLPARHVDTGMGFERVTGIIQNSKNFTDFTGVISNYETDIFRPIFDKLEELTAASAVENLAAKRPTTLLSEVRGQAEAGGAFKRYRGTLPPRPCGNCPDFVAEVLGAIPTGCVMTASAIDSLASFTDPRREMTPSEFGAEVAAQAEQGEFCGPWWRMVDDDGSLLPRDPRLRVLQEAKLREEGCPLKAGRADVGERAISPGQFEIDIAFRVVADHIRTLSFAIADGINPSNEGRGYVLRRILRRAVRYGRCLGFHEPFLFKLVAVLADTMGQAFPEVQVKRSRVEGAIRREEEAFNETLDKGLEQFDGLADGYEGRRSRVLSYLDDLDTWWERACRDQLGEHIMSDLEAAVASLTDWVAEAWAPAGNRAAAEPLSGYLREVKRGLTNDLPDSRRLREIYANLKQHLERLTESLRIIPATQAFKLYDTYGFPLDLTELMARERGLTVDVAGFNELMEKQRKQSQGAQKKQVIELSQIETLAPTQFVGYDKLETPAKVLDVVPIKDRTAVVLDTTTFYAEMGGQVGDTGQLLLGRESRRITDTQRSGNTWLHFVDAGNELVTQMIRVVASVREVEASVDRVRRNAIQRHHTVTHLVHWALHEVVSKDATQKGSYVGPEKLTFDFNSAPLTHQQVADIEKEVNQRILENAPVSWREVPYSEVKNNPNVMQLFGEKYGDVVRVVQVGDYSLELCGGTHTRATGEIGLFRIVGESAIAAGVRRIEAVAGLEAYNRANQELQLIKTLSGKVNSPVGELEKKIESLLAQQKEMEKQLKAMQQKQAAETARSLAAKAQTFGATRAIIENLGPADGDFLQSVADALKSQFKGVVVLGGVPPGGSAVALVATVSPELTKQVQAGKIIQAIAPIVGGKGGGKPDNARGGGKEVARLDEALAQARKFVT